MIINTVGKWIIIAIIAVVVVVGGSFYLRGDEMDMDLDTDLPSGFVNQNSGDPYDGMIASQIAQYEIVLRQGKMPDTCAQAKTIAMLYLQKQDSKNYAYWDSTGTVCEQAYIQSQLNENPYPAR